MKRLLLVLFFVAATVAFPSRKREGETCIIGGREAVCRLISDCPTSRSKLEMGIKPSRCGFQGKVEIVCCPSAVDNGTVSQKKCNEYQELYRSNPRYSVLTGIGVDDTDLPHMAAVGYYDRGRKELSWRCAGTLISDQYVMTAAHCCKGMDKPAKVLLGSIEIRDKIFDDDLYEVDQKNIIVHPQYKAPYNDIGLLKLKRKVIFSEFVSPACLYSSLEDPKKTLIAAGWGATDKSGMRLSKKLLMTYLQAAPLQECRDAYETTYTKGVDNSIICAGDPRGNADTCRGDSGGPLFLKERSDVTVVGVTSLGKDPCGTPVSVYVRVARYIDWIESIVWP